MENKKILLIAAVVVAAYLLWFLSCSGKTIRDVPPMTVALLVAITVAVLFIMGKCSLNPRKKEGFKIGCFDNNCTGFNRTPVDYAEKSSFGDTRDGWQSNPHFQADPKSRLQPLDFGPIDLEADATRLYVNNGVLFQQYSQEWKGCGIETNTIPNDEKSRFDARNVGDETVRRQLDNEYNPSFGPRGITNTEADYLEPSPFSNIYYAGLPSKRLG